MTELLVPQDALDHAVNWTRDLVARVPDLAGFTVGGTQLKAGVTPAKHIRVMVVGSGDYHRVGDRVSLRFQIWREGPEKLRNSAANQVLAHTRASLIGRKEAGPVTLPDPADNTKHLTQFEVSVLMIGKEQP